MTTELNKNQLRVKVAEACGWRSSFRDAEFKLFVAAWVTRDSVEHWLPPMCELHSRLIESLSKVPDYPNDLNACAEFEKAMLVSSKPYSSGMDHEQIKYCSELRKIVGAALRKETVLSGIKKPDGSELLLETSVYSSPFEEIKLVTATAEQRCITFLKVKGIL